MAASRSTPREGPPGGPARSLLWWAYLGLQLLLFIPFAWVSLRAAGAVTGGAGAMAYGLLVVDALGLAGLFFWLRGLAVFDAFLWRAVVLFLIARLAIGAVAFAGNLVPWDGTNEQMVALVGLGSILAAVPLVVGLWCYAFRSGALWRAAVGSDGA